MSSAISLPPTAFRVRHLAGLAAPVLSFALVTASDVAARPRVIQPEAAPVTASQFVPEAANPEARIELAGNRKKDSDDDFDPYGKDDPTNKRWGESAGLGGNRYGGLNTPGDAKNAGKKAGKNSERDDREPRPPRGE